MKVLEIAPQGCASVFSDWGEPTFDDSLLLSSPEEIALVVFTGGEDVDPSFYGEIPLRDTCYRTARDFYESKVFKLALKNKIPMVGICRGSQFLCVKSGGKLVQDIGGHLGIHSLKTSDGRTMMCNSSHHQMQLPNKEAICLAWAGKRLSNHYLTAKGNIEVDKEHEVVYYPNIKAIGVQFHPEWHSASKECIKYTVEVTSEYLFGGK